MKIRNNGVNFERVVQRIQAKFDSNSKVTHNENLMDKLGHRRQFDIVIRGFFAGQNILGIIECKDTKKKELIYLLWTHS